MQSQPAMPTGPDDLAPAIQKEIVSAVEAARPVSDLLGVVDRRIPGCRPRVGLRSPQGDLRGGLCDRTGQPAIEYLQNRARGTRGLSPTLDVRCRKCPRYTTTNYFKFDSV